MVDLKQHFQWFLKPTCFERKESTEVHDSLCLLLSSFSWSEIEDCVVRMLKVEASYFLFFLDKIFNIQELVHLLMLSALAWLCLLLLAMV